MRSVESMLWIALVAAALSGGCSATPSWMAKAEAPSVAPSAEESPAAPAGDTPAPTTGKPVMAYVNGRAILMAPLEEMLVEAHGMEMSQQLIASELVNQAAAEKGLTVSPDEIQAEHVVTLEEMLPGVTDPTQRQELWEQMLIRRNVSRRQWDMTMTRNALLGKLAGEVQITPDDVEGEYQELYGRKVVVRHIQLATLEEAQEVLDRLDAGESFALLAQELSKNPTAANGELLDPIGARAQGLPPVFRDAALAMDRVGQIAGPVQVGTTYHLLLLERIIEPADVAMDDVRDKLTASLRARRMRSLKQQALADMIRAAKIEYVHPVLAEQAAEAEKDAAQAAQP